MLGGDEPMLVPPKRSRSMYAQAACTSSNELVGVMAEVRFQRALVLSFLSDDSASLA
jgi:hypothetical protein